MVEFTITFLVAFPFDSAVIESCEAKKPSTNQSKKKKLKSKSPSPKSKSPSPKSKGNQRHTVPVEQVDPKETDPNFVNSCPRVKRSCYIKYKLTGSASSAYSITVVYWGHIAKVYTKERTQAVKCIVRGSLAWLPFSVRHTLNIKDFKSLVKLHGDGITFSFGEEKKNLHPKAKSDGAKVYYKFDCDEDQGKLDCWNCHLVETVPGKIPEKVQDKLRKDAASSKGSRMVSRLQDEPEVKHRRTILDSLLRVEASLAAERKARATEEVERPQATRKRVKSKRKKKTLNPKIKIKPDKKTLSITGDQLFFEWSHWFAECPKATESVAHLGLCLSVDRLLNEEQRKEINTFGVYVKSLTGVPEAPLLKHRVKGLAIEGSLGAACPQFEAPPTEFDSSSRVDIGHVKTYLFSNSDSRSVIEAVQKDALEIKIYGLGEKADAKSVGAVYGTEPRDDGISNRIHHLRLPESSPPPKQEEEKKVKKKGKKKVAKKAEKKKKKGNAGGEIDPYEGKEKLVIGQISLDCSSLMKGEYVLDVSQHVTSQEMSEWINEPTDWTTTMAINFEPKSKREGIVQKHEFLENDTQMQLAVQLGWSSKTRWLMNSLRQIDTYSCIVLIISNRHVAAHLIKQVYKLNAAILDDACTFQLIGPQLDKKVESLQAPRSLPPRLITGFIVDCIEYSVMTLEGLANFTMPFVLSQLIRLQPQDGRLMHDSDVVFTKRIYSEFLRVGCVYAITLVQTLTSLMCNQDVYIEGNVPRPTWKALKSLDLLVQCSTLKSVMLRKLLPLPEHLVSLDVEFGVHVQLY